MTTSRFHLPSPARSALRVLLASGVLLLATGTEGTPAYAGGGLCHANAATKTITTGTGLASEVRGLCYAPTVLYVEPGQTVEWTNRDPVSHTVTGVANAWGSTQQFALGQSVSFRFDAAGTYPYFCLVHPMMQAVVVVGDGRPAGMQQIAAFTTPAPAGRTPAEAPSIALIPPKRSSAMAWAMAGAVLGAIVTGVATSMRRR